MATFNLSSWTHPNSYRLVPSNLHRQIIPTASFYQIPNSSSFLFPSISLRSTITRKETRNKGRCSSLIVSAFKKLAEADLVAVPPDADSIPDLFPSDSGVYAIYDASQDIQFIGISLNIAAKVLFHRNSLPDLCCFVKAGILDKLDKAAFIEAWQSWIEEYISATGKYPPGNEYGNTTWLQQPETKKSDLRLTPGRHVQLTVPLEQLIDRLVKENKVVAFIKGSRNAPLCGFSQRVVGILRSVGIDYETVDVLDEDHNPGLRETLKTYSSWPTFPQIYVGGELIGGCDILATMFENGELFGLLKKCGA